MTQHNIIGSERCGAHVVIRRFAPARRSLGDRILIGIGAFTVLTSLLIGLVAVLS